MKKLKPHRIPNNALQALHLAGRTGFLSRGLWYDYFGSGNLRWKQRQLKALLDEKIITPHTNPASSDYFVLTKKGQSLVRGQGRIPVSPPPLSQIYHDEWVAKWLMELQKSGVATAWINEAELKSNQIEEFQLSRDLTNKKYPDGVFKAMAFGKIRHFAIEYERTPKALQRCKNALWLYSRSDAVTLVIFVCESAFIRNAMEGRLKFLNIASLWDRVALTMAADWRTNPLTAPLTIGSKVVTLSQICQKKRPQEQAA